MGIEQRRQVQRGAPRQRGRQPVRRTEGGTRPSGGQSPGEAVGGNHEVGALSALAAGNWMFALPPSEGRAPRFQRRALARVEDLRSERSAQRTCGKQGALPLAGGVRGVGCPRSGGGLAPPG